MNKSTVLKCVSGIALALSFIVLFKLGLDMHLVQEWRINGESTKANIFLLIRGAIIGVLLLVSYLSIELHDAIEANEAHSEYEAFE